MQRFRGGLIFKAHRLCASLNSRLESNKEEQEGRGGLDDGRDLSLMVKSLMVNGDGHFAAFWCSNLRLIDSCITLLKAQGPSRPCNESKEEEEKKISVLVRL